MKYTTGNFKVTRRCCTSGQCFTCRGKTPFGTSLRIEHGSGYSREYAEYIAQKWREYDATVEPV